LPSSRSMDSTGGDGDDSLYPVAVLIDELKHEDVSLRLNSMRRLCAIATALGPTRTRTELIGFLNESVDDEDEILSVMAEELGKFVEYVGGAEFAFEILTPLETLATVEESSVRDKAVASINKIAEQMSSEHLTEHYIPLVRRLATRDWFTSRISSSSLFAIAYPRVSAATQADMRTMFGQLCRDDTPMVRRAASAQLGKLAPLVEVGTLQSEIVPLFTALADDDQDSVRLLTVDNCLALAKALPAEQQISQVLPVVFNSTADRSWRVRWSVANKYCDLCEAFGPEVTNNSMAGGFEKLLQDLEAEVRTAAAFKVTDVAKMMEVENVLGKLLPCINNLAEDTSEHVRAALATTIMGLAPVVGRENTINQLLPLFLRLLRDENSEVRLNIISKLEAVNKVIGIDLLSQSLLPAIVELAEDRQWRVRLAIIEYIPLLAKQLGVEFFDQKLCGLCKDWLGDNVYSIRQAATRNLLRLTEVFGCDWSATNLVPKVLNIQAHTNYLHRLTSLNAVSALAEAFSSDEGQTVLQTVLLPPVLRMAEDPVPNIRFNVCKTLQALIPKVDDTTVSVHVKPVLLNMVQDTDRDVKFYAGKALATCP